MADGTVYVSGFPQVVALDATTLSLEWPWEDPDDDSPVSTPVDQAVQWRHGPPEGTLPDRRAWYSPALSDELAFVPFWGEASTPELRAIDRRDGGERWVRRIGERTPPEWTDWRLTPPVVTDDAVLVGADDGTVYCFGHDGDAQWGTPVGGVPQFLLAGGPRAVVGVETPERSSALLALDLDSGDVRWRLGYGKGLAGAALAVQRL